MSNGSDIAQSSESVAYNLMNLIRSAENNGKGDRQYMLDLYAECLETTRGNRGRAEKNQTAQQNLRVNTAR